MNNVEARKLMKKDPNKLIDIIKDRVRNIDYIQRERRDDIVDYISAKVKGQIAPMLRLARTARRGHYPKWVEFNKLLDYFGLQGVLTRENNYSPIPEHVINHYDSRSSLELENAIFFMNCLHRIEDDRYEKLFEHAFEDWARPALESAFKRVDIEKSDREIVSYVCKVFFTEYIARRAESQGLRRKRRGDKWVYYQVEDINDEDFEHSDVMQVIFQSEQNDFPSLSEIAEKLTRRQTDLLIKLYNYVRDDVSTMSTERFYNKYPHKKMNYKQVSDELGISYESFVKNMQRIKSKVV